MSGWAAYWQGLAVGFSMIVAIGAQNAFVLTQSLKRNHHLAVAGVCALIDLILISIGVAGLGGWIAQSRSLSLAAALGGAVFLFWFGARALRSALKPGRLVADGQTPGSLKAVLAATLAISLLNPHVYLDTVLMLGSLSAKYPGSGRYFFGLGACLASVIWFASLALAGRFLVPVFKNPRAWQVLDSLVCLLVWGIALQLIGDFIQKFCL